ncbi:hypothetical protein XENTR_v10018953 [Xenopus tropicalis]|uniref:Uncharacterized protein LOC100145450 isoform X1 n=1 Tax=Xenopus tropicalis TaxID=8364 RepID=A0A8J0SPZ7_XENTR|nr:uncharacterized protein LOC100145450 isoform X1 [Xenopus tropicalis]XP_012821532.2 uncharacterized protein LOC100145450 isoform X1 [Xenopus tropicalis]XP_012821533.2 uncharacterized protein LOC100145450 isoform X1 [Xenopus tropicalis]KAE8593033.1 hypothetical protein XENTR_v10018953 [Xenopus tropicalis]
MFHQMPVTFFDVAASFTEQQWSRLETWKKELYQNVMKELHGALTTLGYKIENPEILFKIKNADDTCVRIDVNSKEKENIDSKDLPDIVVRIKEETSLPCTTEEQSVKVNQNVDSPAQSFPVITSATSLCIKEEQPRTEVPACKSVTVSQEDIGGQNPILVKTEEESYSIDHYNSGFVKSDRSAAGPVEIKQEPEPTSDDDNNFSNIIPVVVKQEDGDSFSHKIEEAEPIGYYRLCDRANSEGTQQGTTSNMVIVPKRSKLTSEANEDQLSVEVIATKVSPLSKKETFLPRFRIPTCEERDNFIQEQKNKNTMRKTKSDISTLLSFTQQVKENRKIEDIPHEELDLLLSKFILALKRKDGKEYEPHTVRCLIGSIDRYLKEQNYPQPILHGNNREFPLTNKTLSAKIKYLKKQGKGNHPNKGEALTDEDIENLYKTEILSLHNPSSLLNLLFFNNGIHFALRTKEQYDLQWGDITLKIDNKGNQYLEYNERRTRTAEHPQNVKVVKPRMYGTPETPERDPITAYIKFKNNRPPSMLAPDSPFYLAPNTKYNPGYSLWYRAMKIGIHKMRLMMTSMKIKASLPESRRIKNNLIRKTIMQNLTFHHLSLTEAEQSSGHMDIDCISNYSLVSDQIQQTLLYTIQKDSENQPEIATSSGSAAAPPLFCNVQENINSRIMLDSIVGRKFTSDSNNMALNIYNESVTSEPPSKRAKIVCDSDSD